MRYLFVLLIFWILPASAETPLSKPSPSQLLFGNKSDPSATSSPPKPGNLSADWWRYFDVAAPNLKPRVNHFIQELTATLLELPEDLQADARAHIERISENLQTQLELRKKAKPEPPHAHPLQKTYTLKQWQDIVHKRRTIQAELQSENEDILSNEHRLTVAQQRLDSMTAAYLSIPYLAPTKAARGIALIAAWSEQSLNSERLGLQKVAAAAQKAVIDQLVEEGAAAQNRLAIGADDLQKLKQDIDVAKRELDAARENASHLATSLVTDSLETDKDKSQALLYEQLIRHGAIKEAIADAVLTRKNIELELAQILTAPNNNDLDGFRAQLREHLDHISTIAVKLEVWRDKAERDQGRAGKSLAALFSTTTKQSGEVIKLTQQRLAEVQNTLLSLQRLDSEIQDVRLLADRVRGLIALKDGSLKSGLETVKSSTARAWELVWDRLGTSLFRIGETPVTILGILRVVLIVMLAWTLSLFVRRGLRHLNEHQRGSASFLYTLGRLAHYLILTIGISIGLSSIGIDLSNFALIAGALSLGIGFGLQAIVSNFVSGLIVLFERSLRIGDFVELSSGLAGEVRAINVRSTLVTTTDMVDILVPNSEFVNGKVINWTLTDASRRIHIPFGVAYGSDKELVRKAGLEAALQTPHTLKDRSGREPEVWLTNFGDSSLDFELIVWVLPHAVKKPQRVRAAYYWELETALSKYGIQIPFPQRDLHIRSGLTETTNSNEPKNPPVQIERE